VRPPLHVACVLHKDHPWSIGLPVTTHGAEYHTISSYFSRIHHIICSLVLTSGAGMSIFAQIYGANACMYASLRRCISFLDSD
jgi:hypothetical protein